MYEIILFANFALFAGILLLYLRTPAASVWHPATFYSAVHGFVFVVRPIIAWFRGYASVYGIYHFQPTMDVKIGAVCAAALAYCIVMCVLMRWAAAPVQPLRIPNDIRNRFKKPILMTAAVLGPLAFYSALSAWNNRVNDFSSMITTASGYKINTTGVGYFTEAQNMLVPLILMVAWVFRFRLLSLVPFVAFVMLKAGSGGRGPFVIAIAALGLMFLYERGRKWPTPRVLGLFAVALILFSLVGQDRGESVRNFLLRQAPTPQTQDVAQRELLDGMDYANLEYLEFVITTIPEKTRTYNYFLDNLQIVTEPIPRLLWKGKPVGPPIQLYDLWDYGTPWGMTVSIPGYGWMQLGWFGVVIWAFFIGAMLALIYRAFLKRLASPLVVIAYMGFLAGTILYFRDGGLLTVLRSQMFFLFPVLIAHVLSLRVRPRLRALAALGPAGYQQLLARRRAARRAAVSDARMRPLIVEGP